MSEVTLKTTIPSLEDVSGEYQDFYVEDKDSGGFKLGSPAVLKRSLRQAKEERDAAKAEAESARKSSKTIGDYTPEKIKSLEEEVKTLRQSTKISQGDLDGVKSEIREAYEAKLASKDEQLAHRDKVIENNLAKRVIKEELAEAGFTEEGVSVLPYKIRPSLSLQYDEDGNAVLQPMKPGGKLPMLDDVGDPLSLRGFIQGQIKSEHAGLVKGNIRPGSGAPSTGNYSRRVQNSKLWHDMTPGEQATFISQHGRDEADNLRAYSKSQRSKVSGKA